MEPNTSLRPADLTQEHMDAILRIARQAGINLNGTSTLNVGAVKKVIEKETVYRLGDVVIITPLYVANGESRIGVLPGPKVQGHFRDDFYHAIKNGLEQSI